MATAPNKTRSAMRVLPLAALALALAVMGQGRASASILQVESVNADEIFALIDESQSSGSTSSGADDRSSQQPNRDPNDSADEVLQRALNLGSPGSNGSTSSTSSTSTGGAVGGSAAFLATTPFGIDQDRVLMRLALGQSLFLPSPLGLDLLRPPRA